MFIAEVDSHPVRLRASHDLTFLSRWGRVFRVLDDQDSGNLCFGVAGDEGKVFVKYAGAPTVRFDGEPADAVKRLRAAATVHRDLAHPALVRLREAVDIGAGHALVFDWTDAISVGRAYDRRSEALADATVADRADAVATLIDFHVHAASRGWVAVDLYDGSVMRDPATGLVLLCDLDAYEQAPYVNPVGRMWGSTRFMSPEEYRLGAPIDERTMVFTLGALAHTFLGDDAGKARADWIGTDAQFAVAARAMSPDPSERWPSVEALAKAWADAGGAVSAPTIRDAAARKADALAALAAPATDVWVATSSADGVAHLVPLTLAWTGERVVLSVQETSLTGRNLSATGRARLAVGPTRDVVMIDAVVERRVPVDDDPPLGAAYADQADWDPRGQPGYVLVVLRPVRIQAWRSADEARGRTLMRDGSWTV